MSSPLAQKEFELFKELQKGKPVHGTFYYHYARLIEALEDVENVEQILQDPEVTNSQIQHHGKWNYTEGVGSSEAPRGTLFHHYKTDNSGKLLNVNLLIATGQNNPSMNHSVLEVAKQYVNGSNIEEGMLNRVESTIRCYDPCLSCSTHAIGKMPLIIELLDSTGKKLNSIIRN
jgi:NAD-reducing hydrogenase large subunit